MTFQVNPFPGAEAQIEGFQADLFRGEGFPAGPGRPPRRQGGGISRQAAVIPPTAATLKGVGRGPQSQVRQALPVLQVVPAEILFPPGKIGHLILEVAAVSQKLAGKQEQGPLGFLNPGGRAGPGPPAGTTGSPGPGSTGSRRDAPGRRPGPAPGSAARRPASAPAGRRSGPTPGSQNPRPGSAKGPPGSGRPCAAASGRQAPPH